MGFDEFATRLKDIKADFLKAHGRELKTVEELEQYLMRRKFSPKGSKALKSLKGLNL
jgi:hypothetical protein